MKRITIILLTTVVLTICCKKDEVKPLNKSPKDNLKDCRKCGGSWDITDSIP